MSDLLSELEALMKEWENSNLLAQAAALRLRAIIAAERAKGEPAAGLRMGICCCAEHHPNHGRCLQCPVHGIEPIERPEEKHEEN